MFSAWHCFVHPFKTKRTLDKYERLLAERASMIRNLCKTVDELTKGYMAQRAKSDIQDVQSMLNTRDIRDTARTAGLLAGVQHERAKAAAKSAANSD